MALAKEVMGGGFSAGQAKALSGGIRTGITAAGTTQGTATTLTSSVSLVGTATSLQGVILPSCEVGDSVTVFNDATGVTIVVYPDSSSKINQLATNIGMNLPNNTAVEFFRVSSTRWVAKLSA